MDGLDLDKISDINLHKRRYSLSNIIFTQDKDENVKEYTVSTKINSVWYYCDNNNNVSILKEYLLNNSYVLYYTRIEATL
jgi:ubiquitin C-terminal hydrolase